MTRLGAGFAPRAPTRYQEVLRMRRSSLIIPIILAALIGIFIIVSRSADQQPPVTASKDRHSLADIELTDADGRSVRLNSWPGQWLVLFFGYSTCPSVCPTSLAYLTHELRDLGEAAQRVQPVFVSVDPAHDRPEVLKGYIKAFDPRLLGVTGKQDSLRLLAKKLGVYFEDAPRDGAKSGDSDGKQDTIMHSGAFFVLSPSGELVKTLSPPQSPGALKDLLEQVLVAGAH